MVRKKATRKKRAGFKKENRQGPLSLYPLSFDEAVTDMLKAKPEPKKPKGPNGRSTSNNKRQPD